MTDTCPKQERMISNLILVASMVVSLEHHTECGIRERSCRLSRKSWMHCWRTNIACEGPAGASPNITVFTSNKFSAWERNEGEVSLPVSEWGGGEVVCVKCVGTYYIHPLFFFLPSVLALSMLLFLIQTFKRPFRGKSPMKWFCQGKYYAIGVLITVRQRMKFLIHFSTL